MTELDHDAEAPVRARPRAVDRNLLGVLLIGLGTVWFLSAAHLLALSVETVLSGALMLLGIGLIFTSRLSRRKWPIWLGMFLTLALILNSASLHFPRGPYGDQRFAPQSLAELQPDYTANFGRLDVDLSALKPIDLASRTQPIRLNAIGGMTVILPQGTPLEVDGRVRFARLTVCGKNLSDGFSRRRSSYTNFAPGKQHLTLDIGAALGDVEVDCMPTIPALPSKPTLPGKVG